MEADRAILFADICNSTGITEAIGDSESRRHFASILDELGGIANGLNGTVVKTIGDEIMCAFESNSDALHAAVEMQRALSVRPAVGGIPSAVKIGVHAGPVILEGDDMFGDVVNVAARVIGMAAAEQLLTTGDTLQGVDPHEIRFRSLGNHQVRGRDVPLHLCEILWRGETAAMTAVAPNLNTLPTPEMEFALGDQVASMTARTNEALTLGRGQDSKLVVPGSSASRAHAKVVRRGTRYYLEDHSTNGTYLVGSDGNEIFVHRDQVLLTGAGRISLGEPVGDEGALNIVFKTVFRETQD
ncbi:MAG: adenylate/guanylate cyclase domain-containing protein [Gemmatimonadota bacterium]